ncbi:MAG: hypothetical protein WC107_02205 [Patescibacteria group bacterium]
MAQKEKKKNLEQKIQEKVNEKVQNVDSETEQKIVTEVDKVIAEEIKKKVTSEIEQRIGTAPPSQGTQRLRTSMTGVIGRISGATGQIPTCFQSGGCKFILFSLLVSYLIIGLSYLFCALLPGNIVCSSSPFNLYTVIVIVAVIGVILSITRALFSTTSLPAILFSLLLSLPLLIIISIYTLRYIGLMFIVLAIFTRMGQGYRR